MPSGVEVTKQASPQASRAALMWSVLILMLLIIVSIGVGFFGYRPASTHGISMEPALRDGDALLMKHVNPDEINVGDIVILHHPGKDPIAHRVVSIDPLPQGGFLFQTRGDANQLSEWWAVAADRKVAVAVAQIRLVGNALDFVQTLPGLILLLVTAIVLVVVLTKLFQRQRAL